MELTELNGDNLAMKVFLEDCKDRFFECFKPAHDGEIVREDITYIGVMIEVKGKPYFVSRGMPRVIDKISMISRSSESNTHGK